MSDIQQNANGGALIGAPKADATDALPAGDCCGKCQYARFEITAPHLRDCCYDPPKIFMAQGPRGPMFVTEFPKVKMAKWCGKFKKK